MLRTWSRQPRNALVSFSSRSGFVRSRIAYSSPSHNKLVANKQFHSDSHNAPPPFSYHLAVSASGKKSGLTSVKSGVNLWTQKHVEGQEPVLTSVEANSGQDAFFMAQVGRSRRHVVLSVVDGVGGWEQSGVNPAAFAHGLTRYMADATLRPDTEAGLRPIKLLQKGYDKVQKDKTILAGGSTACVATADSSGYLEVANLGDSGFVILSPDKVSYMSEPQTLAFNTPYQLSKLTPQMAKQREAYGAEQHDNLPSDSDVTHHELKHGDVVIMGTDGLWDNLSASEVLHTVSNIMKSAGYWPSNKHESNTEKQASENKLRSLLLGHTASDDIANNLAAKLAFEIMYQGKRAGLDRKRDGPFAKEVHKHFPNERFHGGKTDDIAVIACVVVQDKPIILKAKL